MLKPDRLLGKGHRNGLGTVHGGTIFALADYAFAMACNSRGRIAVAASATISFMKAAASVSLVAEAEEVATTSRLGTYLVRVAELHADGTKGDLVALFQGTAYRKKETIDDVLAERKKK